MSVHVVTTKGGGKGYRATSHTTGRPLGPVRSTRAAAEKDVRRAERFGKSKRKGK